MEWKKFTIVTTDEAEDLICGMLAEMGYESVEVEDARPVSPEESGGLFGDVVPELPENDHSARVSFYTDADAVSEDVIGAVMRGIEEMRAYADPGDVEILEAKTAEEDWINNWKAYFHSFRVDDILICPTWEELPADSGDAAMVLRIDPGTAFGTGAHESTQIAIRLLRQYLPEGGAVLDVGTGSGILGIVALRSGASRVFGTDIDENTLPAIADNLVQNRVPEADFPHILGNLADDPAVRDAVGYGCYDLVCANIIAEILAQVIPVLPPHMKEGACLVTSGILREKEELVAEAAARAGFTELARLRQGEWSGIVFRK